MILIKYHLNVSILLFSTFFHKGLVSILNQLFLTSLIFSFALINSLFNLVISFSFVVIRFCCLAEKSQVGACV
ncbi:hypothetical protein [Spiroplasma endosymbiont of Villa modesta]|uniref:hypothetical protein n=1 Tax=Spiroplasma endosymbiont of Villa modesta TaxID=3066293 RepID=UPI00313C76CB